MVAQRGLSETPAFYLFATRFLAFVNHDVDSCRGDCSWIAWGSRGSAPVVRSRYRGASLTSLGSAAGRPAARLHWDACSACASRPSAATRGTSGSNGRYAAGDADYACGASAGTSSQLVRCSAPASGRTSASSASASARSLGPSSCCSWHCACCKCHRASGLCPRSADSCGADAALGEHRSSTIESNTSKGRE